jgi:translation initiation factor IF-2
LRIHELAKELGVASKDVLASLEAMGYEGRTASSTVPEEAIPRLRASGGHVKPGIKPVTATEDQLPRRRAEAQAGNGEAASVAVESAPAPVVPEAEEIAPPAPTPEPAEIEDAAAVTSPPVAQAAVRIPRGASAQDLAEKLGRGAAEIIKTLIMAGEMVTATQSLSDDAIELVAWELGFDVEITSPDE